MAVYEFKSPRPEEAAEYMQRLVEYREAIRRTRLAKRGGGKLLPNAALPAGLCMAGVALLALVVVVLAFPGAPVGAFITSLASS